MVNKRFMSGLLSIILIIGIITSKKNIVRAEVDITAPQITNIVIDKKVVTGGETIKITADISDDLSGVSYVEIGYMSPNAIGYKYVSLELNSQGKYEGNINIGNYDAVGEWTVGYISLEDNVGNYQHVYPYTSGYEFLTNANFTVEGTILDAKAPKITSIVIDKKEAIAGETIKITADISDDLSGVSYAKILYTYPNRNGKYVSLELNSQGKYEGTITIDNYTAEGQWTVSFINLCDNAGNETYIHSSDSGYEFLTNANYIVKDTISDSTVPEITSISIDKREVVYGETIKIIADISDDLSGVSQVEILFKSPDEMGYKDAYLELNAQGKYEGTLYVSTYDAEGEWTVYHIGLYDNAQNYRYITPDDSGYEFLTNANYVVSATVNNPTSKVTFNSNGGSLVDSQLIEYGFKATKPADPTKTGYTFAGWYKEAECLNVWNFITDKVITNTTLYAKWSETGDSEGISNFVTRLYQQCLNREPDSTGLSYWKNKLMSKVNTGADISYSFIFSPEFIARNVSNDDFINIMYKTFFDRSSDNAGKAYWMNKLNSGISRLYVLSRFVNSTEFSNICTGYGIERGTIKLTNPMDLYPNITTFVYRFYDRCLERKPDDSGLNYHVNRLATGKSSGSDLANSFVFSAEFTGRNLSNNDFVKIMYRVFFNRDSDIEGMTYWVNKLNTGTTRLQAFNGFVNSKEFAVICSNYGIKVR